MRRQPVRFNQGALNSTHSRPATAARHVPTEPLAKKSVADTRWRIAPDLHGNHELRSTSPYRNACQM